MKKRFYYLIMISMMLVFLYGCGMGKDNVIENEEQNISIKNEKEETEDKDDLIQNKETGKRDTTVHKEGAEKKDKPVLSKEIEKKVDQKATTSIPVQDQETITIITPASASGEETTAEQNNTSTAESSKEADGTPTAVPTANPTKMPIVLSEQSHNHDWIPIIQTVNHSAEYETRWVVDQSAYDEQILVSEAYDEEITTYTQIQHEICYGCSGYLESLGEYEFDAHMKAHALAGENEGFYTQWENVPNTSFIHHDAVYNTVKHSEVGHNEQILIKDAWTESITAGYKCSCGAEK